MNIPPDEFLRPFFDAGETVCLRVFSDKKPSAFKGLKLECQAGKILTMEDTLRKHNAQHRGVYFVVNHGGHEDGEINRINAVFVENDNLPIPEQIAQLEAFALPPSLMVKTAKSVHAYWLVKDVSVPEFRTMQKRLVAQFDGDPACVNESRVLRLPGFYHCKGDPVMVECIKFSPELRYTKAQLDAVLPKIAEEPVVPTAVPKGSRKGLRQVSDRCNFIRHCRDNAATLPEILWYAMISNLAVFDGGDKAIHAFSKPYPKYSYTETEEKIRHFLDSGTKPMTCQKIAESGYKCPRLDSGGCECKSPAALCYKPLTTDELLAVLNTLSIPGTAIEKIQTIKAFIQEYLYNVEPVIAETMLAHNVREQFRLKVGDMAPLLKLHRDTHKKYAGNAETRRETEGADLPDWYEPNEKGGLKFLPCLLADHMAANIPAFYGAGSYYFYDHGVYEPAEDLAAFAAVRGLMLKTAKTHEISDAEMQWRSAIRKLVREINPNPFLVNVRNGFYNVLDGGFKPHTTEYYSTVQISANYDPTAKCPRFLTFLSDILPESELPLIQEIFGYLIIPVNKAQKSFVFVGAPNAGKSTLLSIAQEVLLGPENVSNIPWQGLSDRFNKAELFGKLANIFADLPSKAIDDGGMFKALTGEDSITAERKNKDPFSFRPYARLLFSCNEIPKNYADRTDGFYRRLIIIRFDNSVPQEKRDPNLRERIAAERDGILTWALDGLRRLIANNYLFGETDRTRYELQRYKVDSNSVLAFVDEYCVTGDGFTPREELYARYKDFCTNNGLKPMAQNRFNAEVEGNYPEVSRGQDRVSGRRVWRGILFIDGGRD